MTKTMIVQYRTAEDRTDENAELVRAVYAQLADEHPAGVAYRRRQLPRLSQILPGKIFHVFFT